MTRNFRVEARAPVSDEVDPAQWILAVPTARRIAYHAEELADRGDILDQFDEHAIVLAGVEERKADLADRTPLQRVDTLCGERVEIRCDRARHDAQVLQAAPLQTGELVVEARTRIVLLDELDLHVAPLRERRG